MCTVSVKVNEALLRGMRPELNSTAAIRQWAQQQREYALDRDMTPEQLYAVISEEIDDIYANG